ncbi:hypothetical protein BD779DRAFT_1486558 [Infundibulicybe gibba]|nr:hypothetical protein BD779DRAFT_1486558 [Infundibulicybe gibba]
MNESILERLAGVEDRFLGALNTDYYTLQAFDVSWRKLLDDIESAKGAGLIEEATMSLAHSIAEGVQIIADQFVDMQKQTDSLTAQLLDEVDSLFSQISLEESNGNYRPVSTSGPLHTSPSYLGLSRQWLLHNLHNPYPSKEIRSQISCKTGHMRKDIDAWFVEARKRIGWTSLRKTHFNNKRADIIDAATRFFVQSDPKRPLLPGLDVAFANIQGTAFELYSSRSSEKSLASGLGAVVVDMTPQLKPPAARRKIDIQQKKINLHMSSTPRAVSQHPSNPPPDLPVVGPGGRGISAQFAAEQPQELTSFRNEIDIAEPGRSPGKPIPQSPAVQLEHKGLSGLETVQPHASTMKFTKRKRCLSESDTSPQPKRPCNHPTGPRSRITSSPFPFPIMNAEAAVDEWLQLGGAGIDIPNAVTEPPDSSEPLEISLFDFSTMLPEYTYTSSESSLQSTPVTPEQYLPATHIELPLRDVEKSIPASFFSDLQTAANEFDSVNHPLSLFEFEQDGFPFVNYSTAASWLPTELEIQPSPPSTVNFLQPTPTPFSAESLWDWRASDMLLTNPIQSSGIFSDLFQGSLAPSVVI